MKVSDQFVKLSSTKGDVTLGDRCNDDFKRNTSCQYCCDVVSNGCNIVPTLLRCGAQKIVVANFPVLHHLKRAKQRLGPRPQKSRHV